MNEQDVLNKNQTKADVIRIELGDWLFNAGIVGFIKILSRGSEDISEKINIQDSYIEFKRSDLEGFTDKFFETAFEIHGKYDSIFQYISQLRNEIEKVGKDGMLDTIAKRYKINKLTEEEILKTILEEIIKRWKGVAYESFKKIRKTDFKTLNDLQGLINELYKILKDQRIFFVEKEVQTFLRGIVGGGSFLNKSVSKGQKNIFQKDFEEPIKEKKNKEDKKFNCIYCNSRKAKANTIFNTGLVFYQGLNKDTLNYSWGFNPNLPLCEICELIYFCHWAGYTKSLKNKTYLFINDDSNIRSLWKKNQLLAKVIEQDKKENILINYFYELLLLEERELSAYSLQNIAIIETDLEKDIMPKILSLHISRNQAHFIKDNHEKLKWFANKYYKIKDDYTNILHEFLRLILGRKLDFGLTNRLIKLYLQKLDKTTNYIQVNYNPTEIQQVVLLTVNYLKTVKQKSLDMEQKHIWHIYHLGNDMQKKLKEKQSENKINGIAYRLLNAVRANDKSTFLNVLLRLYIGYDMEVPKNFVNTLESEEKFQIIGYSYINGLLGEPFLDKYESK